VPVGVGVTGETAATTVTVVPWLTVEGFTVIAVELGRVPAARVNDDATDTDD
jgi:hypothetical protein